MDERLRAVVSACAEVIREAGECDKRGQRVSDDFLWALAMLRDRTEQYTEGLSCYWREEYVKACKAYGCVSDFSADQPPAP